MPTPTHEKWAPPCDEGSRSGAGEVMTIRTCGFAFTTTGRPCANHVADGVPWCRAGHPCTSTAFTDDEVGTAPDHCDAPPVFAGRDTRSPRLPSRSRRATELLRQAMASEDADEVGLRAHHVLADCGTALALLGGADASSAARAAVIQRFGRVGALLVLGYEERGRALLLGPEDGSSNGHSRATRHGHRNVSRTDTRGAARFDDERRNIERLVREFADLDALGLYLLLGEIDHEGGLADDEDGADAHRWLHATYAVAARDGTPEAHRAYMRALDRVMRLVRPLVAS